MEIKLRHVIFILILITILHISAGLFSWYETRIVWVDNLQHVLAGIAFAMLFLLIRRKNEHNVFLMIGFVLLIAMLWELFEFLFLQFLPFYAQKFSLYSPTFLEAGEDILSNVIGGIVFAIWNFGRKR